MNAEALRLLDSFAANALVVFALASEGKHEAAAVNMKMADADRKKLRALLSSGGWRTMESAPRDATPVDLWRHGERLTNYRRVKLAPDNVFYEPVERGYSCVRDAEYWRTLPLPPNGETK